MIVPVLALAGNLAQKKRIAASGGSFPVSGVLFVVLLVGTVADRGGSDLSARTLTGPHCGALSHDRVRESVTEES